MMNNSSSRLLLLLFPSTLYTLIPRRHSIHEPCHSVSIEFITVEVRLVGAAAVWRACDGAEVPLVPAWLAVTGGILHPVQAPRDTDVDGTAPRVAAQVDGDAGSAVGTYGSDLMCFVIVRKCTLSLHGWLDLTGGISSTHRGKGSGSMPGAAKA
jgi:hypothetical protein